MRFPNYMGGVMTDAGIPLDDAPYANGEVCRGVAAERRTPVYSGPSTSSQRLWVLPRNRYAICILGVEDGWGIFSGVRDPHRTTLKEIITPEEVSMPPPQPPRADEIKVYPGHYGWVQLKDLDSTPTTASTVSAKRWTTSTSIQIPKVCERIRNSRKLVKQTRSALERWVTFATEQ